MNAVEHVVEAYFRTCRRCFVMPDVKVESGNGRQCDLLAVNLKTGDQYHVESSVTHGENWCPDTNKLRMKFDMKFRGIPKPKEGKNTDFAKGKTYQARIVETYRSVGFDPDKVQRLWCCWDVADREKLPAFLEAYRAETGVAVEMLWFPEDVLEGLLRGISTANYDDEVLRLMSLIRENQRRQVRLIQQTTNRDDLAAIIKRVLLL